MKTYQTIDGKSYSTRTPEEWRALPKLVCSCGARFYQQVAGTEECDDCISCDDQRWPQYHAKTR